MKITRINKSFDMTINAAYNTYKFQSGMSAELPEDATPGQVKEAGEILFHACVDDVYHDIDILYQRNFDFQVVWNKRKESLEQLRILLTKENGA